MEMEMEKEKEEEKGDDSYRNWVDDLPDLAISNIFGRLSSSVCDLYYFFTVFCSSSSRSRTRRDLKFKTNVPAPPPLLCCMSDSDPDYCKAFLFERRTMRKEKPDFYWSFKFSTITPETRIFKSVVLSQTTIARKCVGYSHGHLIFYSRKDHQTPFTIANVFTGNVIRPPTPPLPQNLWWVSSAILTGPPSSSSSSLTLVLVIREKWRSQPLQKRCRYQCDDVRFTSKILYCAIGRPINDDDQDQDWSTISLSKNNLGASSKSNCRSLLVFNGQVFALLSNRFLLILDLPPLVPKSSSCWKLVEIQTASLPIRYPNIILKIKARFLVDCGGELLMVNLLAFTSNSMKIKIYRLDSAKNLWVEQLGIGDWCIFINIVGECPPACSNPTAWGGKANCVYLSDHITCSDHTPHSSCSWIVYSLEDDTPTGYYFRSEFFAPPVWVYPSMLL